MQGTTKQTKGEVYFLVATDKATCLMYNPDAFLPTQPYLFLIPRQTALTLWWQGSSLGSKTLTWIREFKAAVSFSSPLWPKTLESLSEIKAICAGTSATKQQEKMRVRTEGMKDLQLHVTGRRTSEIYTLIDQNRNYAIKTFNEQKTSVIILLILEDNIIFSLQYCYEHTSRTISHTKKEKPSKGRGSGHQASPRNKAANLGKDACGSNHHKAADLKFPRVMLDMKKKTSS